MMALFTYTDFASTHARRDGSAGGHLLAAYVDIPIALIYMLCAIPLCVMIYAWLIDEMTGSLRHRVFEGVSVLLATAGLAKERVCLQPSLEKIRIDGTVRDRHYTALWTVQLRWLAHTGAWFEGQARKGGLEPGAARASARALGGCFARRQFEIQNTADVGLVAELLGADCSKLARCVLAGQWSEVDFVVNQAGPPIRTTVGERLADGVKQLESVLLRTSSVFTSAVGVSVILALLIALLSNHHSWIGTLT